MGIDLQKSRETMWHKEFFKKTLKKIIPELKIPDITGITIDSRKVQQGDIFIALKGENTDGHNYIEIAIEGQKRFKYFAEELPGRVEFVEYASDIFRNVTWEYSTGLISIVNGQ